MNLNNSIDKTDYKLKLDITQNKTGVEVYNLKNSNQPTIINCMVNESDIVQCKCPYVKNCGNCNLLNIKYETQLELKKLFLQQLFNKLNVNVENVCGMYYPYKYRNKVHLSVSKHKSNTVIGFLKEGSSEVTEIPSCLMHDSWFKILYTQLNNYIAHSKITPYNKQTYQGELRYAVARYLNGNLMLTLVTTRNIYNGLKQLYTELKKYFKNVSLYININTTKSSAVLSDNFIHKFGTQTISGNMCGVNFELSPKSFLQVNTQIATKIYNKVSEILNLKQGNTVIDCFSGIGISSLIFAKAGANVESIELENNACKDAVNLAKMNNLSDKIKVNCGDCNKLLIEVAQKYPNAVMFADPPRAGLGNQFIETLINSNIKKVVYLSCNPITLINDLTQLKNHFNVLQVLPYDMFPHTKHIETLVTLQRK